MHANRLTASLLALGLAVGASAADFPQGLPKDLWEILVPEDNPVTPDKVELGRRLYYDKRLSADGNVACATCHAGADFTDNQPHDVGTGAAFITPSLVDVNVRAPLFHDGCAMTLEARFGPCGGGDAHGKTSGLTRAQEADLVAYMQSL